jgi:hypothetical protein
MSKGQEVQKVYKNRPWTQAELDLLYEKYGLIKDEALAAQIGRAVSAMRAKASALHLVRTQNFLTASDVADIFGISVSIVTKYWVANNFLKARKSKAVGGSKNRPWHLEEKDLVKFIKTRTDLYDPQRIDRALHPYWRNLVDKIFPKDFIPKNDRAWTPRDDAFLLNNRQKMTQKEIALKLRRTHEAVHARETLLRRKGRLLPYKSNWKNRGRENVTSRRWTPQEDQYLRDNWGKHRPPGASGRGTHITGREIGEHLGRTLSSCWTRASRLGLLKYNWKSKAEGNEEYVA